MHNAQYARWHKCERREERERGDGSAVDGGWGSSTFNDAQATGDRTYDAQRIILVRAIGAAAPQRACGEGVGGGGSGE